MTKKRAGALVATASDFLGEPDEASKIRNILARIDLTTDEPLALAPLQGLSEVSIGQLLDISRQNPPVAR